MGEIEAGTEDAALLLMWGAERKTKNEERTTSVMITGKILKRHGWTQGRSLGLAKDAAAALAATGPDLDSGTILARLDAVKADPSKYLEDPILGPLAAELHRAGQKTAQRAEIPALRVQPLPYGIWGAGGIDAAALAQMDNAMRLPISVAGALMPDAHVGYGLPIGGVLATRDSVIPYAVGVDIGCRMRLSIYRESPDALETHPGRFEKALQQKTYFGAGVKNPERPEHEVLGDPAWKETRLLRGLRDIAALQLGTSGSGNHFVEWGVVEIAERDEKLGLDPGRYLALLSHSGSRAVGFKIANAYSQTAMDEHPSLDSSVRQLSWLSLDSEAGQEYWQAMELAGRFASANHFVIHRAVAKAAGIQEAAVVENHHNFAWHEIVRGDGGEELSAVVHRKGATPAGKGVLGVIPGSMGDPGFVVRGRGVPEALSSTAHGAGRAMGRRAALKSISRSERDRYLRERGIRLLGGGIDESPQAYKRIEDVIAASKELIDIVGKFEPRIVRMADERGDS
jgi:tRNA-splicing ligase RtcB (3'-phosphate/5'-hydroxy nucleic acid ligase)